MTTFSYYDATGLFTSVVTLPDGATPTPPVGGGYLLGEYDADTQYVSAGAVIDRPIILADQEQFFILADGSATVVIPGLPAGTVVTLWDGSELTTAVAETLTIKPYIAGEFEFTLTPPWPYVEASFTVIAYAD
jgi:hypothetical protein